jgi:hypothetical protein
MTGVSTRHEAWQRRTTRRRAAAALLPLLLLPALVPLAALPAAAQAGPQGVPAACDVRGPDQHAMWCQPTTFQWLDASGGTKVALADDEASATIVLPFVFPWYGESEAAVHIGSNGALCFGSGCGDLNPPALPSTKTPNGLVACLWEDLNPAAAGAVVRHKTLGQAPDRTFLVEFMGVPHYGTQGNNTFQIQLLERGEARCMWQSVYDDNDGIPTAVGVENRTGLDGLRLLHQGFTATQQGVRFFPCATCAAPSAPLALAARPGPHPNGITLTWQPPAEENGFPLDGFRLHRDGSLVAAFGPGQREWQDCCFGSGSRFTYTLRATNYAGDSPAASVVGKAPSPPSMPQAFQALRGPEPGQITLRWAPPADDGGLPVHTFRVWRQVQTWWGTRDDVIAHVGGSTLQFTDCCFSPGQQQTYRVSAITNLGEGPSTPHRTGAAPVWPGPPSEVAAQRGPGAGQISLTWAPPSDDGGTRITKYQVWGGNPGSSLQRLATLDASALAYRESGLAEGQLRAYRVKAVNGVGEGGFAPEVQQRAPTRPGAPWNLTAAPGSGMGQVQLAWASPADTGGIALASFQVYRLGPGGQPALLATLPASKLTHLDTNASILQANHYLIKASNAVGQGPGSNQACSTSAPWSAAPPPTGEPCPAPDGFEEREVLRLTLPLGGARSLPPVDAPVARVDLRPKPSDGSVYEVQVEALGQRLPKVGVFTNGALQGAFHADLLHVPALVVPVPGLVVDVQVAARYATQHHKCLLALDDACAVGGPNPFEASWMAQQGTPGLLVVRASVRDQYGNLLAEQVVALPFAGLVAAGAPGIPGAPALPGVPQVPQAIPGPPAVPPPPPAPAVPSVPALPRAPVQV